MVAKTFAFLVFVGLISGGMGFRSVRQYWEEVLEDEVLEVELDLPIPDVHLPVLLEDYMERRNEILADTHKPYFLYVIVLYDADEQDIDEDVNDDVDGTIQRKGNDPEFQVFVYVDTSVTKRPCKYHERRWFRDSSGVYNMYRTGAYRCLYKRFVFEGQTTLENKRAALTMQCFYTTVADHKRVVLDDPDDMQFRMLNKMVVRKFALIPVLSDIAFRHAYEVAMLNIAIIPLPWVSEDTQNYEDVPWSVYNPVYGDEDVHEGDV